MFSLLKRVSIKGTSVHCLRQYLTRQTHAQTFLHLLPTGQNLPFVQYIATLAIVQAVQQLAQQKLQVPFTLTLMAAVMVEQLRHLCSTSHAGQQS